jgi:hypothetical protein
MLVSSSLEKLSQNSDGPPRRGLVVNPQPGKALIL